MCHTRKKVSMKDDIVSEEKQLEYRLQLLKGCISTLICTSILFSINILYIHTIFFLVAPDSRLSKLLHGSRSKFFIATSQTNRTDTIEENLLSEIQQDNGGEEFVG